jgi:hypothetical protein
MISNKHLFLECWKWSEMVENILSRKPSPVSGLPCLDDIDHPHFGLYVGEL